MHPKKPQPVYIGIREQGLARVFRSDPAAGTAHELPLRLDLGRHSPSGPEWGYRGSGPAQLALAMAADFLGEDRKALACYRSLQHAVIAGLPYEGWTLEGAALARALESCQ